MTGFIGQLECIMPDGDYRNTCINIELDSYLSSDSYVPKMCKLFAECDDGQTNILTQNIVYLPINTKFTEVSNIGGYLAYGKNILSNELATQDPLTYSRIMNSLISNDPLVSSKDKEIRPFLLPNCDFPLIAPPSNEEVKYSYKENSYECMLPSGSYTQTCKAIINRYKTSDRNLKNTELCEIKLNCTSFEGVVASSTVYFNIGSKEVSTVQKIENCNGAIVIGNIDSRCSGLNKDEIASIGKRSGKTGKFRS